MHQFQEIQKIFMGTRAWTYKQIKTQAECLNPIQIWTKDLNKMTYQPFVF